MENDIQITDIRIDNVVVGMIYGTMNQYNGKMYYNVSWKKDYQGYKVYMGTTKNPLRKVMQLVKLRMESSENV